jgi:large repetitive protein
MTRFDYPLISTLRKRLVCLLGVIGLFAVTVVQAQAQSASCMAVNAGAFTLTNPALGPANSSILTNWNVGEVLTVVMSSADGISRSDGLFHGPTFAAGTFGALATTAVPTTGTVTFQYTVASSDLTNGIAIDPENDDSVAVGCGGAPTVTNVSPNTGTTAGGTSVVITGTNFSSVNASVTFNGTAAPSFTVNSSTQITATTPAGTGTVPVVVSTITGTSNSNITYTYANPSVPTVSYITPTAGRTAGGTVITIVGANFALGATVNFGNNAATSVTVDSSTTITATSPAGTPGTVDVTV